MTQKTKTKNQPYPIDVCIGSRVKLRRSLLGLTQERLAESLGLTFQQVQKYESGTNKIGASRLFQMSQILQVPIEYFFEDILESDSAPGGLREANQAPYKAPNLITPMTIEMIRHFTAIQDESVKKQLLSLVKALAKAHKGMDTPEGSEVT
ncbi:MAG: helix-turn-helix domain-containing protein [Alphaproteobacteria bacterium]|nr:helix-turn-helix domain-containing protein [Alphaproteobacteria bacterium]